MRREWTAAAVVCLMGVTGCDFRMAPVPPPAPPEPAASNLPALEGELEISLFDETSTGAVGLPTFTVRTPRGAKNADGSYSFEDAVAVIGSGDNRPPVTVKAGRGELNHDAGVARLYDGVEAQAGAMTITLSDLEWNNEAHEAVSRNSVTVVSGDTQLQASAMRLELGGGERVLTLENLAGMLVQEGLVQP